MIFISILYYFLFGIIILDAVFHNKYNILRYFIYSSQMMHLIGILEVSSPPSILYFVQNVCISSFTSPLFTRMLMSSEIETKNTYFYNAGFETSKALLILVLPIILIILMIIIVVFTFFAFKYGLFSCIKPNVRKEFAKNIKETYWKQIIFNTFMVFLPYIILLTINDFINFTEYLSSISYASIVFSALLLIATAILTVIFQIFSFKRLYESFVEKETKSKVIYSLLFVIRRVIVPLLIFLQVLMSNFMISFWMFFANLSFILANQKWRNTQGRYEHAIYCISELTVMVFSFSIVCFTSYNLDIYDKQIIGTISVTIIMILYCIIVGMRIAEIIKYYKKKSKPEEEFQRRNATQLNIMNNVSHLSEDASENVDDVMNKIRAYQDEVKEPEPSYSINVNGLNKDEDMKF